MIDLIKECREVAMCNKASKQERIGCMVVVAWYAD